jgi:hypothetical protein
MRHARPERVRSCAFLVRSRACAVCRVPPAGPSVPAGGPANPSASTGAWPASSGWVEGPWMPPPTASPIDRPERVSAPRGPPGVTPMTSRAGSSDCSRRARPDSPMLHAPARPIRPLRLAPVDEKLRLLPAPRLRRPGVAGPPPPVLAHGRAGDRVPRPSGERVPVGCVPRACVRETHALHHVPPRMLACRHARHVRSSGDRSAPEPPPPPRPGSPRASVARVVSAGARRFRRAPCGHPIVRALARRRMVKPASTEASLRGVGLRRRGHPPTGISSRSLRWVPRRGAYAPSAKCGRACRSLHERPTAPASAGLSTKRHREK